MIRHATAALGLPFDTFWDKARATALAATFLAFAVTIRLFLVAWLGHAVLGDPSAAALMAAVSPTLAILGVGCAALLALSQRPSGD